MYKYDWQSVLSDVYSSYPEARKRPVIGITGNYEDSTCKLADGYYKKVREAGGVPVVIPPLEDTGVIINTLERIDGLVLSGGGDFNPLYCGEEPSDKLHNINKERDLPELLIARLAYNRSIPMLGICRGIQTLAMALGGKVAQDIGDKYPRHLKHSQDADRTEPTHSVSIVEGSGLYHLYGISTIAVNSFHHQAVENPGDKFVVAATSGDGIIEAIESREFKPIIGVQWHPEWLEEGKRLFDWLVDEAATYNEVKRIHHNILTLDTHCDTPMMFPRGIHFDHRDSRILVDLHKMTEGRLDACIMVAYLPQPKPGNAFKDIVPLQAETPKEYADLIFNKIEEMTEIVKTPSGLWRNKLRGRRSVMLGIENGIALEGDINNVEYFAKRGVVYITLCHNGDNDICDSALGTNTHNGLSEFGCQVVKEMNRLGVIVDLSHAAEKTFWDCLELSTDPIVCSHSSCRALCDHPRNLTDDQLKALADRGGVCQITIYGGFLRRDGEATIDDLMLHLEHAIEVMGIDHVGIGTDFDGDGGVRGISDASYFSNITKHLLRRGYEEHEIQGILGGNFLRVMGQVQNKLL